MNGQVDYVLGDTAYIPFITSTGTGTPAAPTGTPTGTLYTGPNVGSATSMGVTVTVTQMTSNTGKYVASFAATSGNGFARGTVYWLLLAWTISATDYARFVAIRVG